MKIFAIKDETDKSKKALAYLLYYESAKAFFIELPEQADEWETPLLLSSIAKRGQTTVNAYWSKVWVQQRIVPPDRQNITQILKDNHLKTYDEFDLLMLGMGRCAQDSYYLVPLTEQALPENIQNRFKKRIEDIIPIENHSLLIFFRDGIVKKCNLHEYFQNHKAFHILLKREDFFQNVRLQAGGHGIFWDEHISISDTELYQLGIIIPLSIKDFKTFAMQRIINSTEAAELLGCSRQYINELTNQGILQPIKSTEKNKMYLRTEVERVRW